MKRLEQSVFLVRSILLFLVPVFALTPGQATDVRDGNGGNCVAVKSCRPRCITFRLDRSDTNCHKNKGIFTLQSEPNPWDIDEFETLNCSPAETCVNDKCGEELTGDLIVRINERGDAGSDFYTTIELLADEERFTFCSIYPCIKDECALPEQMGSTLQLAFIPEIQSSDDAIEDSLLIVELALKQAFVGSVLQKNVENRVGPLHIEWMDDPTGCREGIFSPYAPVVPLADPVIETNSSAFGPSLFCEGESYEPSPLPGTQPPSPSPTTTLQPTREGALTPEQQNQFEALELLYNSTNMWTELSKGFHNWFKTDEYCDFSGVDCKNGDVTSLDLTSKRLSGTLPKSWESLSELRTLKLVGNSISGTIPPQLADMTKLTHIELAANDFTGIIPEELSMLQNLRRLMLQYNKLNGTIPSSLCNITTLLAFDVSGNTQIYGEIPPCFGALPLEVLRVDGVGLVGEVPPDLCSVRNINGLVPNLFGCDAIACEAGSYEPTLGRQASTTTKCLPCMTPSNVIGSVKCALIDGNVVVTPAPSEFPSTSLAPSTSTMPSESPSISSAPSITPVPSTSPSSQPSTTHTPSPTPFMDETNNPSASPSHAPSIAPPTPAPPSASPTGKPTAAPSMASTTSDPTGAPTEPPSEMLELTLLFSGISSTMTDQSDMMAFERITKDFANENLPVGTTVASVEIVSQSLGNLESGDPTVFQTRRLAENALFVKVDMAGDTTGDNYGEIVQTTLQENYSAYVDKLSAEIDHFEGSGDPNGLNGGGSNGKRGRSRNVNWALPIAAVVLSIVAVVTVIVVRQYHRKDRLTPHAQGSIGSAPSKAETPDQPITRIGGGSLSDESSAGWGSGSEVSDEGDFVNPAGDNNSEVSNPWTIDPLTEYDGDTMSRTPSTTEQTLV